MFAVLRNGKIILGRTKEKSGRIIFGTEGVQTNSNIRVFRVHEQILLLERILGTREVKLMKLTTMTHLKLNKNNGE